MLKKELEERCKDLDRINHELTKRLEDQIEVTKAFQKNAAGTLLGGHIWKTLSAVDVTPHIDWLPKTDKRPAVSYLPWEKCWMMVKRHFPASWFTYGEDTIHADGSVEVEVTIHFAVTTQTSIPIMMRLPVMNNWFGAIQNPDARAINDARQRCLVKCAALQGLGLDLWTNENVPVARHEEPISPRQFSDLVASLEEAGIDEQAFCDWLRVDALDVLPRELLPKARKQVAARKQQLKEQAA